MDFRKHWDIWGWTIPALIVLIFFFRMVFGREPFCATSTDEHCLREWISALGGWLAVAAAIPTIVFLSKQISEADRHHRQAMMLSLDYKYELSTTMVETLERFITNLGKFQEAASKFEGQGLDRNLKKAVEASRSFFWGDVFDEFEKMFLIRTSIGVTEIRERLNSITDEELSKISGANYKSSSICSTLSDAIRYSEAMAHAAKKYVVRIDSLFAAN